MILVVTLALCVTAITVWYLARPLARAHVPDSREQYQQLGQARDRLLAQLRELDVEAGDHNLDADVVNDEHARLEAALAQVLHDLETLESVRPTKPDDRQASRRGWGIALVTLGMVLPLSAAGLYVLGQWTMLPQLLNPAASSQAKLPPKALEMVARLEKRLAEQPNDAAGWARLGRSYAVMGRLEEAKEAYAKSYKLAPDEAQMLTEYAGLLSSQDTTNVDSLAQTLYTRLHKIDPNSPDALWFLGFSAYQQGDYPTAVTLWERLLKGLPADNPNTEQLRAILTKTREKMSQSTSGGARQKSQR